MGLKLLSSLEAAMLATCLASVVVCLVATIRGDDALLSVAVWPTFVFGLLSVVADSAYNREWAADWANKLTEEIRQADARFRNKENA